MDPVARPEALSSNLPSEAAVPCECMKSTVGSYQSHEMGCWGVIGVKAVTPPIEHEHGLGEDEGKDEVEDVF